MQADVFENANWKVTLASLVAWLASSAFVLVDLYLLREVLLDALTWLGHQRDRARTGPALGMPFGYTIAAVDRFYLLFLACAGISLVVVIEYYYRGGKSWRTLARRVGKVLAIEAVAAGLCLALQWLI